MFLGKENAMKGSLWKFWSGLLGAFYVALWLPVKKYMIMFLKVRNLRRETEAQAILSCVSHTNRVLGV